MHKTAKRSIVFILVAALVFIPFGTSALAETTANVKDIDGGAMAADFLFARPLGILAIVAGSALFIVSLVGNVGKPNACFWFAVVDTFIVSGWTTNRTVLSSYGMKSSVASCPIDAGEGYV